MRRIGTIAALGCAALVATGHGLEPTQAQNGKPKLAPAFSAKANDGKTYSLKSLTGGKTLVLYFIQTTCPVNADALSYYKQIGTAYKDKVNFVGVIDTDEAGFADWQKEFGAKFPVVFDEGKTIIRSYEAIASPWIVVVNPKGEVSTVHKGYSVGRLNELNTLMAAAAGVKAAKIDTKGAPTSEAFG